LRQLGLAPSASATGKSCDLLLKEMDEAGIDTGVVVGQDINIPVRLIVWLQLISANQELRVDEARAVCTQIFSYDTLEIVHLGLGL
jgi:hypothetical protein